MTSELEAPVSGTFLKDSISSFLTRVLVLGIGVAQAAVTARVLHPEGKGIFASAFMIPQLLITLAPLGIHWAATYHLGRGTFDRGLLIRSVLWALLLLGGISMLLCLGAGFLMKDTLLAGVPSSAFFLAVLTIPTQISLLLLDSLFLGEMRIPEANRLAAARGILLFICILILLLGLRWGVNGVILAHLISETCIIVVAVRRFGGVILRPISDWTVLRALLNYGLQIYSFAVLLYLNYRIGLFIVRYFLDLEQTGLFTTAVALAEMLWLVPHSLGRVLFPSIVQAAGAERNRLTLAVCRNTFWIMLILCGVLALLSRPVMSIFFGKEFLPAAPALVALLPGILAMSLQEVLGTDLQGRGRPFPVTLAASVGLVANVALNLWWIPSLGIVGAALASSVSYSLVAALVLMAFLRISQSRFRDAFLLQREDWRRAANFLLRRGAPAV